MSILHLGFKPRRSGYWRYSTRHVCPQHYR